MDTSSRRVVLLLLLMLLLSCPSCDAHSVSECCRQPSRSCWLYTLLCRSGSKTSGGTPRGEAAAGVLTLGKRRDDGARLQSRLLQLLHASRNPAAGILTMGKRTEERAGEQNMGWMAITTPEPV